MKEKILLIVIILIAFLLRFYRVTEDPPSLNWDEVSIAYNSYSILKTGRDEWGEALPLHFKAYGEYKLPAQIYTSIPAVAVLGLNELGVRLTPVLYGTLTVLILFFLTKTLFQNSAVGLLASFLLSISPWHIQLTRASFESSFATFWIVLGIWLLIKGFNDIKWLIISMFPLALSIYTYNSARVFTPLFIFALVVVYKKNFLKIPKFTILSLFTFFILLTPLLPFYLSGEGSSRYKLVSITDDPGLIPRINEQRESSDLPGFLPRLIHNRVSYISASIVKNYLAHFNPSFLFISGAPHKQHHVQGVGEMYLFQLPFVILGLYWLFKRNYKFKWLIILWVLLSIVPVSVTNDSIPHALRTLIVAPVYQIITALGIYFAYLFLKKRNLFIARLSLFCLGVVITVSVVLYLYNYYSIYPREYSRDWQYGYKQVVNYIKQYYDEYDVIVFTRHYGEPHMFVLFYLGYDPVKYQNSPNLIRFETYDWVRVLRFDKFYFPDLSDEGTRFKDIVSQNQGKKLLFIGKPGDFPKEHHRLKEISFLNGDLAFEIVEVK